MSQPQPSSLQHYRHLRDRMGCELALVNAAADVDNLTEQLGRRLDLLAVIKLSQVALGVLIGLLIAWGVACASIGEEAPESDWPALTTQVIHSDNVSAQCGKYALIPFACAEINFQERTCTIYTSVDWAWVLVHEHQHCKGVDHEGETTLRDAWNKYKERR